MTACYPNYDMSLAGSQSMSHHQHSHHVHSQHHQMQQSNRTASILAAAAVHQQQSQQSPQTTQQQQQQPPQKDYSIPLHVDCSVEYELPNQAKPPVGGRVEPLLMIHPCYFRKMESQRRSPFINNMPNSQQNLRQPTTTTASSSSRRVAATPTAGAAKSTAHFQQSHMISHHQGMQQQQQQQQHQNLQQQLDEYVQRQMAHISQQAQFPQPQSNSQYNMPQIQQQQQPTTNGNWERYMPNSINNSGSKVQIPNQNAYKKSGKRHLTATCANSSYSTTTGSVGHLEGALPNGITRAWDEKTVMATIPRDYQSGTEQKSMYGGIASSQAVQLNGTNNNKRDRDPMLSGGCIYSNSNNSNTTDINSLASTTGLWPIQKSPMAAIPNNNYHQAGPDSIPNSNHSSNNSSSKSATVIHHSHYHGQPVVHQSDKLSSGSSNNNNSNSNNSNTSNTKYENSNSSNNVVTVKYRQYRNAHRMHPYMMNNMTTGPAVNNALASVGGYFPQLNGPFSSHVQQVSCYNV